MTYRDRLINTAIRILKGGDPLHLSLQTKLLEEGVDVSWLQLKYGA